MAWEGSFCPEPWLPTVPAGETVSLVGKALFYDSKLNAYSCVSWLCGQHFYLRGIKLLGDQFTVIAAQKFSEDHKSILDASAAEYRPQGLLDSDTSTDIIDVCAGLSIMSAGYHDIQCRVRCHVEINPSYASWLKAKNIPVIVGDAASQSVHRALVPFAATPCIVTGGFACQPFSQLGDRRQELDPRAKSFEGMMQIHYLFQPAATILECTKEASTSPWVQSTLTSMCRATGYRLQQQVCQLQDLWPAKRTRWWAMIVHPQVQMEEIRKFPSLPFTPTFRHLIPTLATWPTEQVQELTLTPHELAAFAEQNGGLGKNSIDPTKPLPTALHAWGSQLTACACGCRAGGFSPQRLQEKGLFGALIPTSGTTSFQGQTLPAMRHIHPDEVAILHLVPTKHLDNQVPRNMRFELTALGQMASPAQAVWHVAQAVQALRSTFGEIGHASLPEEGLKLLVLATFEARDQMLKPFEHTRESLLFQQAVLAKFGLTYESAPSPRPVIIASVASEASSSTRASNKRKALDLVSCAGLSSHHAGVSATGGIELFANPTKPKGSVDVSVSSLSRQDAVQSEEAMRASQTARGKGKGNSRLGSESEHLVQLDAHPEVPQCSEGQPQSAVTRSESMQLSPACLQLIQGETFHITVCVPGEEPHRTKVHAGTTVGQLSQAEAKIDTLPQPIAVTTLSGVPIPLSSALAPAAWYVVQDGALHSMPNCTHVHAKQKLSIDLHGCSRLQGLLQQGPLVAVDEMRFYASTVRSQGHQIADPLVIDDQSDCRQGIASWAMQCMHAHEGEPSLHDFLAPVLYMSHWIPIALEVSSQVTVMSIPHDMLPQISNIVIHECGPHEIQFEAFHLPTGFAADCGFQTVNWMFAHAIGASTPPAASPAQADQWRVPFALHIQTESNERTAGGNTHQVRLGGICRPDTMFPATTGSRHAEPFSHLLLHTNLPHGPSPGLRSTAGETSHEFPLALSSVCSMTTPADVDVILTSAGSTILDLNNASRLQGLLRQGPFVAEDEMRYYVQTALRPSPLMVVFDPVVIGEGEQVRSVIATWIKQCCSTHSNRLEKQAYVVPVLVQSHWSPLALHLSGSQGIVYASPEIGGLLQQQFAEQDFPAELTIASLSIPREFDADCGFQTIQWICG